jgi:hypothetical protein
MATAITKGYSVGDTVYVMYPFSGDSSGWTAATRIVSKIDFVAASNEADVSFTTGNIIRDGATQTVFTTAALCSTAIVNKIITNAAAVVAVDPTTSGASTAGQVAVALVRDNA